MLMRRLFMYALLLTATLTANAVMADSGMAALSETELATVSGQQGVLVNLLLRNNVDAGNAPIGCTAVVNSPNPCRFGLEFADRADTWLMFKEFYGTFQIKDLRMDATTLPASNTIYWDVNRFDSNDGVAGCGATPLLPACNPKSLTTMKFTYPGADAPGTYDDFLSFLNIGRVWLEFKSTPTAGVDGYLKDTSLNSVLGVRMSDTSALNASAKIRFRGTGYVYGY